MKRKLSIKLMLSVLLFLLMILPVMATVNNQPIAKASVSPSSCYACECQNIILDAFGSYDTDGEIVLCEWYYDGQLVAEGARAALGESFTKNSGTYRITLNATDDGGMSDKTEVVFYIKNNLVPHIEDLKYKTSSNKDSLIIGDEISMEAVLSDGDCGKITYSWDYDSQVFQKIGDGSKVTFKVISETQRNYEIGVVASNACGDESNRKEIEVEIKSSSSNSPPEAKIILPFQIKEGEGFQARPGSTTGHNGNEEGDEIVSYSWRVFKITNKGEEIKKTSTRENPSFTLEDSGIFNISLKVTDRFGESGSDYEIFEVIENENDPPIADASATKKVVAYGEEFTLDGSASRDPDGLPRDTISRYLWRDLTYQEDLGISNRPTLNVTFNRTGPHEIELTVVDAGFTKSLSDKNVVEINVVEKSSLTPTLASTPTPPTSVKTKIATPIPQPTFQYQESTAKDAGKIPGMRFGMAIVVLITAFAFQKRRK